MWGEIANAIASTVNTGLNLWGAEKAQDTDVQMFHEANQFNKEEAQRARDWASDQGAIQRDFNLMANRQAMGFNAAETEKARRFNQMMAETEYQRAVGDMTKAGLNPMLAYMKGGSSVQGTSAASIAGASVGVPGGASASSVSPPRARNILGEAGTSALSSMQVMEGLNRMRAETDLVKAQEAKTYAEIPKVAQDTETSRSTAKHLDAQVNQINEVMRKIRAEVDQVLQQTHSEVQRGNLLRVQQELEKARITNLNSDTQLKDAAAAVNRAKAVLLGQDVPRSANEEAKAKTWWGRNVSPYLGDFFKGTQILRESARTLTDD